MFGSGVVASWVYNTLRVRPTITAAIGAPPRMRNMSVAPSDMAFPLALHYAESGTYYGPIQGAGNEPNQETLSYVVRFICQGESDGPIRAAARDALTALSISSAEGAVNQDGEDFYLTLLPSGEWPITTTIEEGVIYRQLGFYLTATVMKQ